MGSNYHEESSSIINSSEEVDSSDQENNDMGVGRSYECVFCKRGFNTAQALGGHMNIHRKDRARSSTKPTSNNPNKLQEQYNYMGPRLYEQIIAPTPVYSNRGSVVGSHQECLISYNSMGPSSSYMTRPLLYGNVNEFDRGATSNPADWRLSLSWEYSSVIGDDLEKERPHAMNNQKEELDLELRLGYDS